MLKKKLNPRGPKKRKLVTSLQTYRDGKEGGRSGTGQAGPGCQVPWAGPPHLELPEHEVWVEIELEGAEELQLLWNQGRVRWCPRERSGNHDDTPPGLQPWRCPHPSSRLTTAAVVRTQAAV